MFRTAFDYQVFSFLSLSELDWGCQGPSRASLALSAPWDRGLLSLHERARPFSIICTKGALFLSFHRLSGTPQLLKLNNFKTSLQAALIWN